MQNFDSITECLENGGIGGDPNESPNDNEGSFIVTNGLIAGNIVDYANSKNIIV